MRNRRHILVGWLLLLAMAGCDPSAPVDPADSGSETQTTDTAGTESDTASTIDAQQPDSNKPPRVVAPPGIKLPENCDLPDNLGPDPLITTGTKFALSLVPHLLDIDIDMKRQIVYPSGLTGLMPADVSTDDPQFHTVFPSGSVFIDVHKYERVNVINENIVAVTYSGMPFAYTLPGAHLNPNGPTPFQGLPVASMSLIDVTDPANPSFIVELELEEPGPMAYREPFLYIGTYNGLLLTLDISDPTDPIVVHALPALKSPREMAIKGDILYAVDARKDLVLLDLSNPKMPQFIKSVKTAGPAFHMDIEDDLLVIAEGADGVEVFSIEDPMNPKSLSVTNIFASALQVSISKKRIWIAAHGSIAVLDAADPTSLVPIAREPCISVNLAIDSYEDRAFVCDWDYFSIVRLDPEVQAPQAWWRNLGAWVYAPGTTKVRMANVGSKPLNLLGLKGEDERLDFSVDKTVVEPGDSVTIQITYYGDGPLPDSYFCVATDAPHLPIMSLPVAGASTTDGKLEVGDMAPDFTLTDLDGVTHKLSDYRGMPVLLVSFATWCPVCPPILTDIEETLWPEYRDKGVAILALGGHVEEIENLYAIQDLLKLSFPILYDASQEVIGQWRAKGGYQVLPYPHDFIIDANGKIVHTEGQWYPEIIREILDGLLAESEARATE